MEEKIFQTVRIQIAILKSRGIVIKNKKKAKDIIMRTNYYNLINGYKDPFLQKGGRCEKYLPGTTLQEIYALYEFDRKLRILTLEYILEIEKQVKALISYCFSKEHGHKNYLVPDNFDTSCPRKYSEIYKMLSRLYSSIAANIDKEPSVKHYVSGKNYVPLWVLVNSISMGEMSKFYCNMKQKERAEVARRVKWGIREKELESMLFFLSSIRNRCAHDERLFSYLSHVMLARNPIFEDFGISRDRNNYFAVAVTFKRLLPKKSYDMYQDKLKGLLNELEVQLKVITVEEVLRRMGMPEKWEELKTYK